MDSATKRDKLYGKAGETTVDDEERIELIYVHPESQAAAREEREAMINADSKPDTDHETMARVRHFKEPPQSELQQPLLAQQRQEGYTKPLPPMQGKCVDIKIKISYS